MKTSRLLSALALTFALASHTLAEERATFASPELIDRLIKEALATHPKVQAAKERSEAARAAIHTVRLWEDPQAGIGFMAARRTMRQDNGDTALSVEQMLPRPGLYKAEKRKAEAEYQAQQSVELLTANELALATAQATLELALADELIRLQAENNTWLETAERTAEERAKNPDASGTEALRLQSELAMRQQSLASAHRQRAQYARALNILLGRRTDVPWQALSLPQDLISLPSVATLQARMERWNPQLASMRHMADSAQAETEAAKERKKPVFSAGIQTSSYSGSGDLRSSQFMIKMTLPWFNSSAYGADIAKADKLQLAARRDLAAGQRELQAQLTALATEAENNRQMVETYNRDVLPKAEKAVETLQNAWISSKATLLDVLDARRALLDARQDQQRALAARHAASHSIAALIGSLATHQPK